MRTATVSHDRSSKISYTARGVAYARSLSNIPLSKKIALFCRVDRIPRQSKQLYAELSPYFEARFKAISNLLSRANCSNVLELAAGFSPRGFILSKRKTTHYIEADLPGIVSEKKRLIRLLTNGTPPARLDIQVANVLDRTALLDLVERFPSGPIAIIHEGLLPYLSHREKHAVASTIREILRRRSGVWITTDILTIGDLRKTAPTSRLRKAVDDELKDTGQDYHANAFVSLSAARAFFAELGFRMTVFKLKDVSGPISAGAATLPKDFVDQQLSLHVWELALD